jgi:predicted DCC family thiol-disulfide oxidoreductase YuxK
VLIDFVTRILNKVKVSLYYQNSKTQMIDIPVHKKIILFDGVCNLCNESVLKVIKYDKKNTFLFAALQSETGKKITDYLKIDISKVDSIILYEPTITYDLRSTAALRIMKDFGGLWYLSQIGLILPEAFRDYIYDFIAKNRYKWFGKKENCMIPSPELKAKFLD